MNDLKEKTIAGIKWSTISLIGRQGTQFITGIILARLLLPSDFGLLGMAVVVTGFVTVFKDLGTSAAIIQQKDLSDGLVSSLFWLNVVFGLLVTVILYIASPVIGFFFQDSRVIPVLQFLSFSFVISSLSIIHKALFERSLKFKPLAIIEIVASLAGSVAGIGLAMNNMGVWSLVFQTITISITTTILLWFLSPVRFGFCLRRNELKKIGKFSLNLIGFNTFNYFCRNADNLLVGRFLGANLLGFYSIGYMIFQVTTNLITGVIGRVVYPVYSIMQDDNDRFATTYLNISKNIAFITFPLMVGEFLMAGPLILTFYGEKWIPVIPLVNIFAPIGLLQSIGSTVGSIYQAKGRTDLMFGWGIFSSVIVVAGFSIGLKWGITGVALSYLVSTFLLFVPSLVIPFHLIDLNFSVFIKSLKFPFFNSLVMLSILFFARHFVIENLPYHLDLIISTFFGVIVYLSASWITNKQQLINLYALIFPGKTKNG